MTTRSSVYKVFERLPALSKDVLRICFLNLIWRPFGARAPEVALKFGHLQKVTSGDFRPEAEGAASRRDDTDRSLARSAWKASLERTVP